MKDLRFEKNQKALHDMLQKPGWEFSNSRELWEKEHPDQPKIKDMMPMPPGVKAALAAATRHNCHVTVRMISKPKGGKS